jgi:hypothetical protein
VFSGVFIAEKVAGVGDRWSGDTIPYHTIHTLGGFSEHVREKCLFSIDEAFCLVKSNTANLGTALIKCQIFRIYMLLDIGLKEFCSICH